MCYNHSLWRRQGVDDFNSSFHTDGAFREGFSQSSVASGDGREQRDRHYLLIG